VHIITTTPPADDFSKQKGAGKKPEEQCFGYEKGDKPTTQLQT